MRLILLTFSLSFFIQFSFAQITLEHDYEIGFVQFAHLSENEYVFYFFNKTKSTIDVYNQNHELYLEIPIDTITGAPVQSSNLSRYLFDLDEDLEIMVNYHYDHPSKGVAIINQDGSELFSTPKTQAIYVIPTQVNARMLVYGSEVSKVYSLPGKLFPYDGITVAKDGEKGEAGEKGEKGDMPAHEWDGTSLRFENPDGSWGEFVDIQGDQGMIGHRPEHEWGGTSIRFQKADGTWGEYHDLRGPAGPEGPQGEEGECNCPEENGKITGTNSKVIKDAILQNPQPNPAKLYTRIFYNLPPSITNVSLGIYNSEGKFIKSFPINSISGSVEVSTSGFSEGIYFYRLIMKQGVSETKKLIISR